jgi:hypothetical protein
MTHSGCAGPPVWRAGFHPRNLHRLTGRCEAWTTPSQRLLNSDRSAIVGEDGGPMGQRQEGVDAMTVGIKADRVCAPLRRHGVKLLKAVDIKDLDETGIPDRHVEVAEEGVEEDDVRCARERQVRNDLVRGWCQDEESTRIAGAVQPARVVDLETVRARSGDLDRPGDAGRVGTFHDDDGRRTIPTDIGINRTAGFLSPIHTHDVTGIIHVESPVVRNFSLGQFFDVWGVRFDAHCVGGVCDGNGRVRSVFLNGQPYTGDPAALVLTAHEEIVVAVGAPAQLPNPIPASYVFPAGL